MEAVGMADAISRLRRVSKNGRILLAISARPGACGALSGRRAAGGLPGGRAGRADGRTAGRAAGGAGEATGGKHTVGGKGRLVFLYSFTGGVVGGGGTGRT